MAQKGFANGENDLKRGIDFIGVGVAFWCHDGNGYVLLHKRSKNCRDEHGTWDCGGGALEFGEKIEDAIAREVQEEYGTKPLKLDFMITREVHRQLADGTPTHWVTVDYAVLVDRKRVVNNEPFKIDEIGWFTLNTLPSPLHSQLPHEIAVLKKSGLIKPAKSL